MLRAEHILHPDVGPSELAVLAVLLLHADATGLCWPSQSLIARILGKSRPWVNATIQRLAEIGLLEKTNRVRDDGGERSCLYRIVATAPEVSCPVSDTTRQPDDSRKNPPESQKTRPMKAHDATPSTEVPEDWQPNDADLLWAVERFPNADIAAHVERFVAKCRSRSYRFRRIGEAWRAWLAEDMAEQQRPNSWRTRKQTPPAYARFEAWQTAALKPSPAAHAHA